MHQSTGRSLRPQAPSPHRRTRISLALAWTFAAAGSVLVVANADARITKVDITSRGPAFGGFSFPGVGTYEKIVGVASGELSPTDPKNAVIVDIQLAPRNARGNVE